VAGGDAGSAVHDRIGRRAPAEPAREGGAQLGRHAERARGTEVVRVEAIDRAWNVAGGTVDRLRLS
jgi:hypothetical protein